MEASPIDFFIVMRLRFQNVLATVLQQHSPFAWKKRSDFMFRIYYVKLNLISSLCTLHAHLHRTKLLQVQYLFLQGHVELVRLPPQTNIDTTVRFRAFNVRVLTARMPLLEKLVPDFYAFGFIGVFKYVEVVFVPSCDFRAVFLLADLLWYLVCFGIVRESHEGLFS